MKVSKLAMLGMGLAMVAVVSVADAAPKKRARAVASDDADVVSTGYSRPSSGLQGRLELDPGFGVAFISPKDVNTAIADINADLQKQGVKSFNMSDLGSTTYLGLAATYRVLPDVGLGLGFQRMSTSTETSAKINNDSINAKIGASANILTAESRLTMYRSNNRRWEIVAAPFMGIGFYKTSVETSGSALPTGATEVIASSSGFVAGSTVMGRYWFMPNLSGGLLAGYRFAKSGDLKVDSTRNSDIAVGSYVENGGKKVALDMTSFMLGAQLTWSI